jgi:hypothetical protein
MNLRITQLFLKNYMINLFITKEGFVPTMKNLYEGKIIDWSFNDELSDVPSDKEYVLKEIIGTLPRRKTFLILEN